MLIKRQDLIELLRYNSNPTTILFQYSSKDSFLAAVAKINFDYKAELNAQQLADGQEQTEPSERPWGTRIPNSPLVEHKSNHYLSVWITQIISYHDWNNKPKELKHPYRDLKINQLEMIAFANKVLNIRDNIKGSQD